MKWDDLSIIERGDYLLGLKKFDRKDFVHPHPDIQIMSECYKHWFDCFEEYPGCSPNVFYGKLHKEIPRFPLKNNGGAGPLAINEFAYTSLDCSADDFYNAVFYCAFNMSPVLSGIPYIVQFYFDRYQRVMGNVSKLQTTFDSDILEILCSEGALPDGTTPVDAIKAMQSTKTGYEPIHSGNYRVRVSDDFTLLYVADIDNIATVPSSLADTLTDAEVKSLYHDSFVMLENKPLHSRIKGCSGIYLSSNTLNLLDIL